MTERGTGLEGGTERARVRPTQSEGETATMREVENKSTGHIVAKYTNSWTEPEPDEWMTVIRSFIMDS